MPRRDLQKSGSVVSGKRYSQWVAGSTAMRLRPTGKWRKHKARQASGRAGTWCGVAVLVAVAVCVAAAAFGTDTPPDGQRVNGMVQLFFPDPGLTHLTTETVPLGVPTDDAATLARWLLTRLIAGPQGERLPALPPDTKIRAVFITPDGTAVVDLDGAFRKPFPKGVASEYLAVFAIVNTLVLNMPRVHRVQILVDGKPAETLAGDIDIESTFSARIQLIR